MNSCKVSKLIFKHDNNIGIRMISSMWDNIVMKCFIEMIDFKELYYDDNEDFVEMFSKYFVNVCVSFNSLQYVIKSFDVNDKMFDLSKISIENLSSISFYEVNFRFIKKICKIIGSCYHWNVDFCNDFKITKYLYYGGSDCDDILNEDDEEDEDGELGDKLLDCCVREKIFLFDVVGYVYESRKIVDDGICGCEEMRDLYEIYDCLYVKLIRDDYWREFVFMFKRYYLSIDKYIWCGLYNEMKLGYLNVVKIVVKCKDFIDLNKLDNALNNIEDDLKEKMNWVRFMR